MSSESGKLQLKVNPKADHDYFPASETEGNEVKGQRWLKSIEDQDQGRWRKKKTAIYSGESKIKIKEKVWNIF